MRRHSTTSSTGCKHYRAVGGALLTPGSFALISASFHGVDRAAAIGAWSGLGGLAGAVGPFVGGFLAEWSWRAVFHQSAAGRCGGQPPLAQTFTPMARA